MIVVKLSNSGLGINVVRWPLQLTLFARAAFKKNGEVPSFRTAHVDTQLNWLNL